MQNQNDCIKLNLSPNIELVYPRLRSSFRLRIQRGCASTLAITWSFAYYSRSINLPIPLSLREP